MDPIAIAQRFTPEIDARSTEIERARRLPQDLADAMASAGLFRMLVPQAYGGMEVDPWDYLQTLSTLARADGAVAWCTMICTTTGLLSATLPETWAHRIYADHPNVITVGVTAPVGQAALDGDDLVVSGRWPFGSGSECADWICGGVLLDNGETKDHLLVFFARDEVTIHDTWDVSGLRGTGSHDFEVHNVRVPAGRWVTLGTRPTADGTLYRFPTFGLLALAVSAVSIGIADRAMDEFVALATQKTPTGATRSLAHRAGVQRDVAECTALLEGARALTRESVQAAAEHVDSGQRLTRPLKARLRMAAAHNAWSAVQVVDRLYHAAGGTSIYTRSKLQQCFRDVHVPTQHVMVGQPVWEVVGKVLLDLDPGQPL